uniref:Uncharacterized protein n=1 Tax=Tetraselmis sp. GSL018 TaxID=582737 RepID=A0A061SEZ9_9CHLO|mmetsp:Transcript_2707/g.6339  ORF Transcript_2707/g.6339 Transcript_2707/m.6339 type:complete len:130 (-) Transcript_2707:90-479(-)|eukprot:CAMPEP_0177585756 /NCGR_PEP_ID=MMETSP0419_2-20121207/4683_1 /TAXON_ID=582737 /ORGANISM="Tetraselmis sp., Strain GSL018" /LENGTH=129 /DNA_ID=CAMNT_0019075551 /DNA_START=400 /DNA_END=789 /DNA_ORIENTATION=-
MGIPVENRLVEKSKPNRSKHILEAHDFERGIGACPGQQRSPEKIGNQQPGRNVVGETPRESPRQNDLVALTVDIPWQNVWRGQVGVVASVSDSDKVEVEFSEMSTGETFQFLRIPIEQLMVLRFNMYPE